MRRGDSGDDAGHGGHGPPRGRQVWGRHGGRAVKGGVRAAILALLAERPMHGYQMISEVADRTRGGWVPSPGSVYPALQMLSAEGLVAGEVDGGRRCYALTEAGRTAVDGAGPPPWTSMAGRADALDARLNDVAAKAHSALAHLRSAGTADQKVRAIEVMTQVRHALYQILVEDD